MQKHGSGGNKIKITPAEGRAAMKDIAVEKENARAD
jgi:hypothetical protein